MGVYIKRMDMPKLCWNCPCMANFRCNLTRKCITMNGRLEDCPLVEVPIPHGRLLDEDVILPKRDKKKGIIYIGNFAEVKAVIESED